MCEALGLYTQITAGIEYLPRYSVEYTWSLPFSFCGHDCGILSVVTNVWHAWTSMLSLFFFLRYLTQVFQTELVVTFTHNLLIDPRSVLFSWRSKLMNLKRVNILSNWWQPYAGKCLETWFFLIFFFWWLSKLQIFVLLQISAWMVLSISLQPRSHIHSIIIISMPSLVLSILISGWSVFLSQELIEQQNNTTAIGNIMS